MSQKNNVGEGLQKKLWGGRVAGSRRLFLALVHLRCMTTCMVKMVEGYFLSASQRF